MIKNKIRVLSEEFLMDLLATCRKSPYLSSVVKAYLEPDLLPSRDFLYLFEMLGNYFSNHKTIPAESVLYELCANNPSANDLLRRTFSYSQGIDEKQCVESFSDYLKQTKFQKAYRLAGQYYNRGDFDKAIAELNKYMEWKRSFVLDDNDFVNIVDTFKERYLDNKAKNEAKGTMRAVTRFYIDELDNRNGGRDLRTQLTCILASTGIGKSHAARWIDKNACRDGYNVLHIQLEGSKAEIENAYSATLAECNTFKYERGKLRDSEVENALNQLNGISGRLYVKSFPKFNARISTLQIKETIAEFKNKCGVCPDIVIIDSMDLLTDASGRKYSESGERLKRINVANDLKDLAGEENVWVVVTYQSTIENQEWLNDEKNVLTEYNTAEAKGLSRPLSHLITLNQSTNERREHTMRINVAKSRFFERGDVFKIATNYDNEIFYDYTRTMGLQIRT